MTAYPIPDAALDDRLGWVGTSGSGKTYNASTAVERLLKAKARVVIIDALDVWWGLRSKADGERASGFNLPIFGGPHGDLPLNENAGALIGETVAGMAESCIISLKGMPSQAAARRFVLAFLRALYKHHAGGLFHLVIDEADLWVPQTVMDKEGDAMKLKGLVSDIIRRGRVKGFIPWLITQRPAVISKDVLSQVDGLIAFKLTSSQDRDALGGWIDGQADRDTGKAILASLPTLPVGRGVVWIPGRGILDTVSFPAKATFDSSRAPKRGEVVRKASLKPLDLGALQERLAQLDAEAKANDPAALKAEVVRLQRELAKTQRAIAAPPPPPPPVIANADDIEAARKEGERAGIAIGISRAQTALAALRVDDTPSRSPAAAQRRTTAAPAPAPPRAAPPTGAPVQRLLNSLAWWKAFGIEQPSSEQVAFMAGYSASSSGFANLKGSMRSAGLIEYPAGGKIALTDAGAAQAEAPAGEMTTAAFHSRVREKLSGPQQRILNPLLEAYPEAMSSADLAAAADYSASSSGFANLRGQMRSLGFVDYPSSGQVRAADWLFPEAN